MDKGTGKMAVLKRAVPVLLALVLLSLVYFYIAWSPNPSRNQPPGNQGYVICRNQECVNRFNQAQSKTTKDLSRTTPSSQAEKRIMPLIEARGFDEKEDNAIESPKLKAAVPIDIAKLIEKDTYAKALNPPNNTLKEDMDKFVMDNKIMLSVVDSGYINFAINLFVGSIQPLGLKNYLYICIDKQSAKKLKAHGIYCSLYDVGGDKTKSASDFGTQEYFWKTNIKTGIMVEVLKYGYDVLLCDLDVVLFHDPFPHFHCDSCDIHIQMDKMLYNSGFVFARSTPGSRVLYQTALDFYLQYHKAHDQSYINMAIRKLDKENYPLKIQKLTWQQFPNGYYYFEADHRMFGNNPSCTTCVMTHNNYLGTVASKIYRFKENLMWNIDENGYYSNASTQYLTYENPIDFVHRTRELEVLALQNALMIAHVLNRTLILPTFRCCNCESKKCDHVKHRCPLMSILKVKEFDDAFRGVYREHSFLEYSLVPQTVKDSISEAILLNNTFYKDYINYEDTKSLNLKVLHFDSEIEKDLTLKYLRSKTESVLKFHSFYGELKTFRDEIWDFDFLKKLQEALQCSLYEQWKENWIQGSQHK